MQGGDCLFYAEGFGVGGLVQEEAVPQFPSLQRAPPALRPSARRRRGVRAPGSAPHAWHLGGRRRHRHHDNPVPDCGGSEQTAHLSVLQMSLTPDEVRSQGIRPKLDVGAHPMRAPRRAPRRSPAGLTRPRGAHVGLSRLTPSPLPTPGSRGASRRTPPAQGKTETRPLGAQLLPNGLPVPPSSR